MTFISIIRILLFPISFGYGILMSVRNLFFDWGIFKVTSFDLPIICVGNLSVGGTGKTPQIEYLIRLLQDQYPLAVLSRGYKRKTKGFVLANENTSVEILGDESYQYHKKYPKVRVAVHEHRVEGVKEIIKEVPNTNLILLDDAYQHRKIKAGYQILLTTHSDLFYKDFMLPTGNLRELWWGKKRANVIVVTKCPKDLSQEAQQQIIRSIHPSKNQQVYFSTIGYSTVLKGKQEVQLQALKPEKIVLVTGIAKPEPLLNFLTSHGMEYEHLKFPDHHAFTNEELKMIQHKSLGAKIVTTEKDYVRLEAHIENMFYLPISMLFLNQNKEFDDGILSFVKAQKI